MTVYSSEGGAVPLDAFDQSARRLAAVLTDAGAREDGAVALLMRNDIFYLTAMEACRHVGAYYVALNWHLAPQELALILKDSGATVLIGHADLLASLAGHIPASVRVLAVPTPAHIQETYGVATPEGGAMTPGVEEAGTLMQAASPFTGETPKMRGLFAYTSGSTGLPKGIKRPMDEARPDNYQVYRQLARDLMHTRPGDSFYVAAPLYHSAPNALSMMAVAAGDIDIFVEPKFDPEAFLQAVEQHRITHAYIVPTMMVRLLKLPESVRGRYDTSSLRYTVGTGSPCPADVKQAMIDWMGPIFNESYGASEIGFMTLVTSAEAQERPGTVGRILPGGAIRILDDDLRALPPGEIGTIYVNLPTFGAFEYTNAAGALEKQQSEGFTTVGDMGYLDEGGYLYICDRKKDMIISGGANIFPAEIEAEIIKLREVADCAVIGVPDPEFGEKILAAVVLTEGASLSLDGLRSQLEGQLAAFKMPKMLDIHDQLPREDSGKIFKARLRAPYWEAEGRAI